ncbi:MAG: NADH-quinone oxidoreductase subunit M [Chloroflexi bacterium]|nr:NADH-quinone oxidoreductase subunit M [Chloroflexota bacterium]MYK62215.1 NADH-quinone oxidoreductase subunit M [Chloroflexota bacterium]
MSEFNGILTLTVFLPALAGLVILLVKPLQLEDRIIRWFAIVSTVVTFVLTLIVFLAYDRDAGGVQFIDHLSWLSAETIKSSYLLGVDGLSAPLVLLTGLLGMAAAFASRNIGLRVSEYFIWLLLLETAVMGVFVSLDLLLFFVFFEFEVIPMFMLISLWGSGRPRYSAMKFVLYTLAGGAFMFVGIFAVYLTGAVDTLTMVPVPELGIVGIADQIAGVDLIAPASLIFAFFFVAFAVKLPIWPLHNWLPDAHTDAPTAVSVMLAGVLLKMAGYGMIRINIGFFQETKGFTVHDAAGILSVIAAVSVVYGAIVTIRQTDMKRLIAYSSVSHMGFVLLGLTAIAGIQQETEFGRDVALGGINGAALQMFTHGTITGLAFLMVGLAYDRTHTRHIPHLGGLWRRMPVIGIFFFIAGFASLGLPALSGFVSEIMVFLNSFPVWPWAASISAFGVVLAAGYVLWMIQRTFFGSKPPEGGIPDDKYEELTDAEPLDLIPILVLTIPIFVIGIWPKVVVDVFKIGIEGILR